MLIVMQIPMATAQDLRIFSVLDTQVWPLSASSAS